MFKSLFYFVIAILAASLTQAYAESAYSPAVDLIRGEVIHVSDGDTLTVRTASADVIIRLFVIDAPEVTCHGNSDNFCVESGQTDGKESKFFLKNLVLHRNVEVQLVHGASGNRAVGTVYLNGADINLEMVKAGHAWYYTYFSRGQSPEERSNYSAAENNARALRLGLWSDYSPVAPWDWRRSHKRNVGLE